MKKTLLSIVAMLVAVIACAQNSLVATLSHEGAISVYYGPDALGEAMGAANHGDIITLSAGKFNGATITKAVTLRGAGMSVRNDSISNQEQTIIQDSLSINIADNVQERLIMEGLYFKSTMYYRSDIRNAQFLKCRFYYIDYGTEGKLTNSTFIHCRIASVINLTSNSTVYMLNSVVFGPSNSGTTGSQFEFDNCVVSSSNCGRIINSYFKNCVILSTSSYAHDSNTRTFALPASNDSHYSVGIINYSSTYVYAMFGLMDSNNTNKEFYSGSFGSIVKSGSLTNYSDIYTYELTDEAKTKYLGNDGREVGLYGGSLPYSEEPSIPQIIKLNVDEKSDAQGKIKIDVEVKGANY